MTSLLAMNTGTFALEDENLDLMLEAVARGGFMGVDFRDTHIDAYLAAGHSLADISSLLKKHDLFPLSVAALKGWQNPSAFSDPRSIATFEEYFQKAKAIGCVTVICAAVAEDWDIDRDMRCFEQLCRLALSYDLKVALEFLPWAGMCDVLKAWQVVRGADCVNGGLLLDTFHFFKGGSSLQDLKDIPTEKIFLVHLCDAPEADIELKAMCMQNRLFPGEFGGIFPLQSFLDVLLNDKQYDGPLIVETFNQKNKDFPYAEISMRGGKLLGEILESV